MSQKTTKKLRRMIRQEVKKDLIKFLKEVYQFKLLNRFAICLRIIFKLNTDIKEEKFFYLKLLFWILFIIWQSIAIYGLYKFILILLEI
jgi:hypothetical protein